MKSSTITHFMSFLVAILFVSCVHSGKVATYAPLYPFIEIVAGDSGTGMLLMSDGGYTVAKQNSVIHWTIRDDATNVKSIDAILPKPGSPPIFIPGNPHHVNTFIPQFVDHWVAQVRGDLKKPFPIIYQYKIIWTDSNNVQHTYDPTIQINQ